MELTNKQIIKNLLKKHNAKPEKYLGQHFILSKKALSLMIAAAEINSDAQRGRSSDRKRRRKTDTIIEIGPGLGTLTQELAKTGANIAAIEKDLLMINILKETLSDYKNVKIIQSDARDLPGLRYQVKKGKAVDKYTDKEEAGNKYKYKIVANLPYNVATFLIHQWLELNPPTSGPPELMVLMIQKEVAQRIVAKPPHSNMLAVSVQFYADAEIIDYVPAGSFWPKPKVDAAIIKIVPTRLPAPDGAADGGQEKQNFFKILKAGFSQPRKQLLSNLTKRLNIPREKLLSMFKILKISEKARAENLSLSQWQNLARGVIHN